MPFLIKPAFNQLNGPNILDWKDQANQAYDQIRKSLSAE